MDILWKDRKRTIFGLPLSFTKYSLDSERLFVDTGFFKTVSNEVRLYRIMDVGMSRTLGQKLFGVGDIQIHSSDKSLHDFTIQSVKNPKMVKELLSETVEVQRDKKKVINREMMVDTDEFENIDEGFDN